MANAVVKSKKTVVGVSIKGTDLATHLMDCEIYFDKESVGGKSYYVVEDNDKVTFKIGAKVYPADQVEVIFEEGE